MYDLDALLKMEQKELQAVLAQMSREELDLLYAEVAIKTLEGWEKIRDDLKRLQKSAEAMKAK